MTTRPFLDTNVLIYSIVLDDPKASLAVEAMAGGGRISVHVLGEFVSVCRRKLRLSWPDIEAAIADILVICPNPLSVDVVTHHTARHIADRYGYGIYDALVIAGGLEAGAAVLLSDDMQHGQMIDGRLTIRNPFLEF